MKNILLTGLFLLFITNCNRASANSDEPLNGFVIDSKLDVYLKDTSGKNIVGTTGYDSFIINYENPIPKLETVINKDRYKIFADADGNKFVRIFLNLGLSDSTTTNTEVKWNNEQTDNFKAEIIRGSTYIIVDKVYLNGQLICADRTQKVITLTK